MKWNQPVIPFFIPRISRNDRKLNLSLATCFPSPGLGDPGLVGEEERRELSAVTDHPNVSGQSDRRNPETSHVSS